MSALRFLVRIPFALCLTASVPLVALLDFAMGYGPRDTWDMVGPALREVWLGRRGGEQ